MVEQFGFKKVAFADKVKTTLAQVFNIPEKNLWGTDEDKMKPTPVRWDHLQNIDWPEKNDPTFLTVRELMQIFATEICRNKIPGIWYQYLDLNQHERLVISDLRFENEARFLKKHQALIIEVVREGRKATHHASEAGLPADLIDHRIENNDSLDAFFKASDKLLKSLNL